MHIPCPKCESKNTSCKPESSNLLALLENLLPKKALPGGKYVVTCKDCGAQTVVMVN
jgi:ribosomal protein S27E